MLSFAVFLLVPVFQSTSPVCLLAETSIQTDLQYSEYLRFVHVFPVGVEPTTLGLLAPQSVNTGPYTIWRRYPALV